MKKLQRRIMRLYTAVCAAVLGALGFTACGWQNAPMYGTEPAYGVPTATFRVRGVVTDVDDNPVEGIRVAVSDREGWDSDTVYTTADGEFETRDMSVGSVGSVRAVLADVDGEENGGMFAPDTVKFEEMEVDTIREGDWGGGEYELSFERKLKKETGDEGEGEKD